jgi:hypothetical protein
MLGFFPLQYLSLISYQGERRRSKAPRLLFSGLRGKKANSRKFADTSSSVRTGAVEFFGMR